MGEVENMIPLRVKKSFLADDLQGNGVFIMKGTQVWNVEPLDERRIMFTVHHPGLADITESVISTVEILQDAIPGWPGVELL
jgi:hypothetical protein